MQQTSPAPTATAGKPTAAAPTLTPAGKAAAATPLVCSPDDLLCFEVQAQR